MQFFRGSLKTIKSLTLAGELQLTDKESALLAELLGNYEEAKKQKTSLEPFLHLIATSDLRSIIKLSAQNIIVAKYCKHKALQSHWDAVWSNVYIDDRYSGKPVFMQPQKNMHSFNLICGNFYFRRAMLVRNSLKTFFSPSEVEFLQKASQHSSIHAVYEMNVYNLRMITEGKNVEANLVSLILRSKLMIISHKYMGYILFAQAHLGYAQYLICSRPSNRQSILDSLNVAFEALEEAKKIKSSSSAEINNAVHLRRDEPSLMANYIFLSAQMLNDEVDLGKPQVKFGLA